MNVYETEFFAKCPMNSIRIKYNLRIETKETILVESLTDAVDHVSEAIHEVLADTFHERFGGFQTMTADHHSVTITTTRGAKC